MNRVILFHTCLVNEFYPDVGFAVIAVLEHLGFTVDVPAGQTCCGQPAFNAGFHDAARAAARHTIALLERCSGPIVIPSGSCGDMVMHHYAPLLHEDPGWEGRARAVAARCVEFSAFVAPHVARLRLGSVNTRVVYHASCHLARGLGIDREPRVLIDTIPGVERCTATAEDECCGFGGLFSLKHADISSRMLDRKLKHLQDCGAQRLVSCDMGCVLHIEGGLHRSGLAIDVQHLAQLLAEALG